MSDEYLLKICVIGSSEFKTKFLLTYAAGDVFGELKPPTGEYFLIKRIQVDGNPVKLILLADPGDTAPFILVGTPEDKKSFRRRNYRGSSAVIITFDKSKRDSFDAVKGWYDELSESVIPKRRIPIALVSFLTESEAVTTEEGQLLAKELVTHYFETRHTDKEVIEEIFDTLILQVLKKSVSV